MNSLEPPSLGPIVGHTTDLTCKLWICAKDYKRPTTVGVVAVLEENDQVVTNNCRIYYFRLDLDGGCLGTFNLGADVDLHGKQAQLKPDTKYKVCLGTLTTNITKNETPSEQDLRKNLPNLKAEDFKDLLKFSEKEKKSVAVFWTFPDSHPTSAESLTFLLGSCHHPSSDSIFVPMDQQVCDARDAGRPRFVLMVGDQIYADKWSNYIPIERAETYEEFQERYRNAFGSRNMRRLLRHVPTYMILDDHEIEDNWSPERGEDDLFANAIEAYKNYQWSHGPCTYGDRKFYYQFETAGYPFFVLDTRTRRTKNKNGIAKNDMLGKRQLNCLLAWLKNMQKKRGNAPKFIVSSNVFVPNEKAERVGQHNSKYLLSKSDSWPAFPTTRAAILDCIVKNEVQNVVFLSGDIHCSNIAEISLMDLKQAKQIKAFSITSSPFHSPIADGDDEDYVGNSKEEGDSFSFGKGKRSTMNYRSFFPFVANANNFCRVEIQPDEAKIVISFFDAEGDKIKWSDPQSTWDYPVSQSFRMEAW